MKSARVLAAALGLTLVTSLGAHAADEGAVLLLRAEQLALEDRCDEALEVVRRSRRLEPDVARAALLEGECAIREHRYAEAISPLEDARRLDPSLTQATVDLGIAHFHLGDFDSAGVELAEAVRVQPDSAEAQLYYGLVLLETADAARAAAALEQARALDPAHLDPAASYYAGRAWQVAQEREKAETSLDRVIEEHPNTPWALEAERALEGTRSRYRRRGVWARFSAGMEYDSNVTLRSGGVVLPSDISDKDDGLGAWYARGGVELFRNATWATGITTGYYGNAHLDLTEFDTHFPSVSVWLDRLLTETTYLRVEPDFGYAWVDNDDFLLVSGVTPSLHHSYEKAGIGRAFFRFAYRDYKFKKVSPAQNRDGFNYIGGYDHAWFPTDRIELRGGLGAGHFDSDQGEYTYTGPWVRVGGNAKLPWELAFDVDFLYEHQFYANRSAFSPASSIPPGRKRDDDVFLLWVVLERSITDHLKVEARYRYQDDSSNIPVFDYKRHIVGGFLTVEFGPS